MIQVKIFLLFSLILTPPFSCSISLKFSIVGFLFCFSKFCSMIQVPIFPYIIIIPWYPMTLILCSACSACSFPFSLSWMISFLMLNSPRHVHVRHFYFVQYHCLKISNIDRYLLFSTFVYQSVGSARSMVSTGKHVNRLRQIRPAQSQSFYLRQNEGRDIWLNFFFSTASSYSRWKMWRTFHFLTITFLVHF